MISDDLLKRTLENIGKTPVAYSYFFENIDSPAWLLPLKESGYFKDPIPAIRKDGFIQFPVWPESGYLLKVADKAPNEVLEIVRALPETDNERVMDDVANILLKVSPSKAARFTDLLKKYVNTSQHLMLHRTVSELICKLAENNKLKPAFELANEMLEVLPDPDKEAKLKSDYVMIKPETKFRDFDYRFVVEKITPSLIKADAVSTVDMYSELLGKAIDYELTFFKDEGEELALEEKKDDFSFISRPNIAEEPEYGDNPDDILTTALRNSITAMMQNEEISNAEKLSKLKDLAQKKYSIFKRIAEYGLRKHKNKREFKQFYSSLLKDQKLKAILDGERSGSGKTVVGFVNEKPTDVLKGLSDPDLIERLKTYTVGPVRAFERDSIANELGQLIQLNPMHFADLLKEIAVTKNEYLYKSVQSFEEVADDLNEEGINTILASLIEIYKTNTPVDTSESHDYYAWSKSSSIKFIEKLVSQKDDQSERITDKCLDNVIELTLLLCRDNDPSGDSDFAPVELSINSIRGKAMHALAYILAWMNRNDVSSTRYAPIFKELDWHLNLKNDSNPAIRVVYGWRYEIFYGSDEKWATKNKEIIFSDDEMGRLAFDAYVMFNRVHDEAIGILGDVFVRQLPRLAVPVADDGKTRHDGLNNLTQHLALHYWYTDMDLSDGSMMRELLKVANIKYLKELANFIGFRLYKSKEDATDETQLKKLRKLWESIVVLIEADAKKIVVLEEFGVWFASGKFDPKWSLEQLTNSASKAGNIRLDFAALDYMETLVGDYPAETLKALSAMIDGTRERWAVSSWSKSATVIIKVAYDKGDSVTKQSAITVVNKLVAKGYIEYRNIVKD